jgi:hypothetical protein
MCSRSRFIANFLSSICGRHGPVFSCRSDLLLLRGCLKGCEEKVVPLLRRSSGWSIDKSRSTAVLDTNSRHCSPADCLLPRLLHLAVSADTRDPLARIILSSPAAIWVSLRLWAPFPRLVATLLPASVYDNGLNTFCDDELTIAAVSCRSRKRCRLGRLCLCGRSFCSSAPIPAWRRLLGKAEGALL